MNTKTTGEIKKNKVPRIVLTGGPCAGKTTALVRVIEHFSNLGYKVFTVPEVPTMVTQSGWNYLTQNHDFYYEGERAILELQLTLEDKIEQIAQTIKEQPCVMICDRGTMDISAYISAEMWEELCQSVGHSSNLLRERYDAVLHLVSAADGAEQYYTTANNAQRYEKADEEGLNIARSLDKKVINAWKGHPHLRVINNGEDFEHKMQRVLKEISSVLNLPQTIEEERKYIVKVTGELPDTIESNISQTYLVAEPGCEVRLRHREFDGKSVNVHTSRKRVSQTQEVITERQVSNSLYESLLQQADPYRHTIKKLRRSFIWQGQFFELDTYLSPVSDLIILETKGIKSHEDVKFPPFIQVVEDITGKTEYYNYNLALKS